MEETPLQKEIREMAERYADPKFRRDSFRWQHMVRIYKDAIYEWIGKKTMELPQDTGPQSMPLPTQEPFKTN